MNGNFIFYSKIHNLLMLEKKQGTSDLKSASNFVQSSRMIFPNFGQEFLGGQISKELHIGNNYSTIRKSPIVVKMEQKLKTSLY